MADTQPNTVTVVLAELTVANWEFCEGLRKLSRSVQNPPETKRDDWIEVLK